MGKTKKRVRRHLPLKFKDVVAPEEILSAGLPPELPHPGPPHPTPPDELWYEIAFYSYYFFSSRPGADEELHGAKCVAVITLYASNQYVGAISFYPDDEPLDGAKLLYRTLTGVWVVGLEYHISQFENIMRMLQTEPHVFVYYRGPINSTISTIFPADYYD